MIRMTMVEDDSLDIFGIDFERIPAVEDALAVNTGIEKHGADLLALLRSDQSSKQSS
jgi:hypothetical protein